jgi:hypothetical protein
MNYIGIDRKCIKYEAIWTTFDLGTGPLKLAIFGLKTLFFANHTEEASNSSRTRVAAVKNL